MELTNASSRVESCLIHTTTCRWQYSWRLESQISFENGPSARYPQSKFFLIKSSVDFTSFWFFSFPGFANKGYFYNLKYIKKSTTRFFRATKLKKEFSGDRFSAFLTFSQPTSRLHISLGLKNPISVKPEPKYQPVLLTKFYFLGKSMFFEIQKFQGVKWVIDQVNW